jgi:hypothetical protein
VKKKVYEPAARVMDRVKVVPFGRFSGPLAVMGRVTVGLAPGPVSVIVTVNGIRFCVS